MVRWLGWHCPPDTGFEIRALAVWGRARYLSVTEAPHNTDFHTWMGKKHFCFFQTAETGNRTPNSGVKGSGANYYPRVPARSSWKWGCRFIVWYQIWRPIIWHFYILHPGHWTCSIVCLFNYTKGVQSCSHFDALNLSNNVERAETWYFSDNLYQAGFEPARQAAALQLIDTPPSLFYKVLIYTWVKWSVWG